MKPEIIMKKKLWLKKCLELKNCVETKFDEKLSVLTFFCDEQHVVIK